MSSKPPPPAVEPLLPVELGKGRVRYAQGMRAGNWIFATGHMAQDFETGIAADVLAERLPQAGPHKREKEAALIYDHLEAVLAAGGTELANVVRTDQYYTTVDAVPHYQTVRRGRFGTFIPPSTSIVERGFVLPEADINVQLMAIVPEGDFRLEHHQDEQLKARPTSGYSPALTVGDFVFVAGVTAMAQENEESKSSVARAALLEEGFQWGGIRIARETEFLINHRVKPALELGGSSMEDVVKAQVYLTRSEDFAVFNQVWSKHFAVSPPVSTFIPCPERGLAIEDGRIEINVLALKRGGKVKKDVIDAGVATAFVGQPQAIKAGDLLFLSGLMAIDHNGVVETAALDARQPHYRSCIDAQADCILDNAAALCRAAGTSLANVVRIQQFHTDIADFYPVYQAWQRQLPGQPLPFTAVEVPELPVPGAKLLMDLWVYAP